MDKKYAVLPCNGLDKCAGCISTEIALTVAEKTGSEIICPVFYRVAEAKYNKLGEQFPVMVVDGCGTRCASKLAIEKGLKIAEKINIADEAKEAGFTIPTGLRLGQAEKQFADKIVEKYLSKAEESGEQGDGTVQMPTLNYQEYVRGKFLFRVPDNEGFFFNENDVWVYAVGNIARVGVTDFVQKSLSDIMFFSPLDVGIHLEQFEEAGNIESGKAVFEIVSPVTGKIVAINEKIVNSPELINENPYEQGWILEIELSDFESDKDLLHEFEGYFPVLKRKVDEFNV